MLHPPAPQRALVDRVRAAPALLRFTCVKMGSAWAAAEKVQNDSDLPVTVEWHRGDGMHLGTAIVEPGMTSDYQNVRMGSYHDVCASYKSPTGERDIKVCTRKKAPLDWGTADIKVSDILGEVAHSPHGPWYNPTVEPQVEEPPVPLPPPEPLATDLSGTRADYLIPGLFALGPFMFALIILRKFRNVHKPASGLQDPLMHA